MRRVASGNTFSILGEEFHIGDSTLLTFDKKFWKWFRQEYWTTWVVGVSGVGFDDITSMEKEEKLFRQMGLPGFITCMDGVHFAWECTPYQVRWKYKDDTTIFAGATNDKTIVLCDKLVSKMCDDPLFLERTCPTAMSVDGQVYYLTFVTLRFCWTCHTWSSVSKSEEVLSRSRLRELESFNNVLFDLTRVNVAV